MTQDIIRVMLVEDHDLVRSGIKMLLEEDPLIQVAAEATNGRTAVESYDAILPDVVMMDISMPEMDGLDASKEILKRHPDARILVLTMHNEARFAARLLRLGALGYITKKADPKALHEAVRTVYRRKNYLTQEAKDTLLQQLIHTRDGASNIERLSDREVQVLSLIAQGGKPKDIAAGLGISVKTADNYRAHLLQKLGLKTNADLVLFARDQGLM